MDVVVPDRDAHRVGSNDHALNHDMRVVHQDVAVLAGTGLTLVGVAHQVLLARELAGHEAPLQTRGEACASATTQTRFLDGGNHLILAQAFTAILAQDGAKRLVAAARFIVLDAPVGAIEVRIDLRSNVTVVKTGFDACRLELGKHLCRRGHCLPSTARRLSTS